VTSQAAPPPPLIVLIWNAARGALPDLPARDLTAEDVATLNPELLTQAQAIGVYAPVAKTE